VRIWSIHPSYLDAKGLVALWRETLLAKHVLLGKTKGYKHHPQLIRFNACPDPGLAVNTYLSFVYDEAVEREYNFDSKKIGKIDLSIRLNVTSGQIEYETAHLEKKLKVRDKNKWRELRLSGRPELHPIFKKVKGEIENWEVV
jgi:hypothetical protein